MCDRSLRCRVLISLLVVLMLGFGVLALYLYDTRDQLRRSIMLIQAQAIGAGYTASSDLSTLPTHYAGSELSYTLYSADGQPLWHSANLDRPRRLYRGTLQDEINLIRTTLRKGHGRVINAPVTLADGSILMVAKEDRMERELIGNLLHQRAMRGLLLLVPFCMLAVGLLFILLQWTLRPIRKAAELAEGIGPHEPDRRIPLDKLPGEVLPLARAANEGLDRLAQAYAYEQRIVGDAAHALRTPLAVLGLRLQKHSVEGAADWTAINQEFSKIHKLVAQVLALAHQDKAQSTSQRDGGQANLARLCREAAGTMLPLFEAHGRTIDVRLEEGPLIQGNADLLREAIRNVLENALYHGAGTVKMLPAGSGHGTFLLDITDEGNGVPLGLQDEMFQRFRKGQESSAGSGLGLAIVRATLRNAGGDVRFVSTRPCILRMWFQIAS
jgi:signal transduction histidine kinase